MRFFVGVFLYFCLLFFFVIFLRFIFDFELCMCQCVYMPCVCGNQCVPEYVVINVYILCAHGDQRGQRETGSTRVEVNNPKVLETKLRSSERTARVLLL